MDIRKQVLFWSLALLGFLAFVLAFKAILLPFVLGLAVAYLLNPLVKELENLHCGPLHINRARATLIILCGFLTLTSAFLAIVTPFLYKQLWQLTQDIPLYYDRILNLLEPLSRKILAFAEHNGAVDLKALLKEHGQEATLVAGSVLHSLAIGGKALFDALSLLVLTPVIAYFMMREWSALCAWMEDLMPRQHKDTIKDLLGAIDQKLSGFVRGQISVALILGVSYAIALSLMGLKYGFLIGLGAGILSIIPMVGSTVGLGTGVLVAWLQGGSLLYMGEIAGIFLIGQLIEGNFLTPKLVGKSVGLHPLWVFFALMAGGALFGVLGLLLAVPVAAVTGVLLSFLIKRYKTSRYYDNKNES